MYIHIAVTYAMLSFTCYQIMPSFSRYFVTMLLKRECAMPKYYQESFNNHDKRTDELQSN